MRLHDLPRPMPLSAYEETRDEVKRKFAGLAGVAAVLEYGTIPLPGISDIDLIVIAEPHARVRVPNLGTFSPEQRFILSHRPFVLSRSVHPLLRFLDPWILHAIPLLEGTEAFGLQGVRTLSADEHRWASLWRMLHWCSGFLRFTTRTRATGVIPCRTFLDHCVGIKYFYRELKRMGLAEEDHDPNISFFVELRDRWFSFGPDEMQSRMEEGLERFGQSLRMFLGILAKHFGECGEGRTVLRGSFAPRTRFQRNLLGEYPRSVVVDSGDEVHIYQEGRTDIELRRETCRTPGIGGEYERFMFALPLTLGCLEGNYLRGDGVISRRYQTHVCTDMDGIPVLTHPAVETLVALTDRSEEEAGHLPLKKLFDTYGYRAPTRRPGMLLARVEQGAAEAAARGPFSPLVHKCGHRSLL